MKAIVHLGLPKTGTTSIQTWLATNAEPLRDRGIRYDRMRIPGKPLPNSQMEFAMCAFHRLGKLIPNDHARNVFNIGTLPKLARIVEEITPRFEKSVARTGADETYVISSEHLGAWMRTREQIEALEGYLGVYFDDIRYVFYIRRQEDWLLSIYSQKIRRGGTFTLDDFLRGNAAHDFGPTLRSWVETVGRDRFDVRLMEPSSLVGGDLMVDFGDALGISVRGLTTPPRQNESLSVAAAEFLRVMNGTVLSHVPHPDGGQRRNPLFRGVEKRLTKQHAGGRKMRVTREQASLIRAANEEANARVCAEFFPDRSELFPPRPLPEVDEDANAPTPEEVARVGLDLYRVARMRRMAPLKQPEVASLRAAVRKKRAEKKARRKPKG